MAEHPSDAVIRRIVKVTVLPFGMAAFMLIGSLVLMGIHTGILSDSEQYDVAWKRSCVQVESKDKDAFMVDCDGEKVKITKAGLVASLVRDPNGLKCERRERKVMGSTYAARYSCAE